MNAELDKTKTFAEDFLATMDKCEFDNAYQFLSKQSKAICSLKKWQRKMTAFREALGDCKERSCSSSSHSKSMTGFPDGSYHTFSYESVFAHKSRAIEAVVVDSSSKDYSIAAYTFG